MAICSNIWSYPEHWDTLCHKISINTSVSGHPANSVLSQDWLCVPELGNRPNIKSLLALAQTPLPRIMSNIINCSEAEPSAYLKIKTNQTTTNRPNPTGVAGGIPGSTAKNISVMLSTCRQLLCASPSSAAEQLKCSQGSCPVSQQPGWHSQHGARAGAVSCPVSLGLPAPGMGTDCTSQSPCEETSPHIPTAPGLHGNVPTARQKSQYIQQVCWWSFHFFFPEQPRFSFVLSSLTAVRKVHAGE